MSDWHADSLRLTNALIGLTRTDDAWPSPLNRLGYRVHWLERRLATDNGECQPDIIMTSRLANHALLFEVKCGTLQVPQHAAYRSLTKSDLIDGGIPDVGGTAFGWDIAYATGAESQPTLIQGLEANGPMPLVVFDDDSISRDVREFVNEALEMVFGGVVDTDGMIPPMNYVPFNDDSSELDIMVALLPSILAGIRHGDAQIAVDDLVRAAMPYWPSFATAYQTALRRKVERILTQQAKWFSEFFDYVGANTPHRLVMKADFSQLGAREMHDATRRWDSACARCMSDMGAMEGQLPLFD